MSSNNSINSGFKFIGLCIVGYILFNIAILESEKGTINYGLFNLFAGCITAFIFKKDLVKGPKIFVALMGALGILMIIYGLKFLHIALTDPASVMHVVYDGFAIFAVAVFYVCEKPLNLPKTPVYRIDLVLHAIMAILVSARLYIHWQNGWAAASFLWLPIALAGYAMFNLSIRKSIMDKDSKVATNATMNIVAGLTICVISILKGGLAVVPNHGTIIGTLSIVIIVWSIGKANIIFKEVDLTFVVPVLIYDGLLICAPFAFLLIYPNAAHYSLSDTFITLGFIAVMAIRVKFHLNNIKKA